MSGNEEYQSAMSFWNTLDNLATVPEDVVGEHLELVGEAKSPDWKVYSNGLIRLNSEGEEFAEGTEEDHLTSLAGRIREDQLFLAGVEYEDEYFESLAELVGYKDQKCNFCKVEIFVF